LPDKTRISILSVAIASSHHKAMNRFRIGTSGWHYKHWLGRFYPPKTPSIEMLSYYAQYFDTVEINNSFYALPADETVKNWRRKVPDDFCFAVKGSRYLTHMKKLKDPEEGIEKFFSVFKNMGEKLGPILFQLPPYFKCNPPRLESFLTALPKKHRYVMEFRDASWHNEEIYDILRNHQAAFCIYDRGGFVSPMPITTNFTYIRYHGAVTDRGNYSERVLAEWASRLLEWKSMEKIFVYFNNDWEGYAINNAVTLKEMLLQSRLMESHGGNL
jgi:uncharacterized protein YecE (DUF72 family)